MTLDPQTAGEGHRAFSGAGAAGPKSRWREEELSAAEQSQSSRTTVLGWHLLRWVSNSLAPREDGSTDQSRRVPAWDMSTREHPCVCPCQYHITACGGARGPSLTFRDPPHRELQSKYNPEGTSVIGSVHCYCPHLVSANCSRRSVYNTESPGKSEGKKEKKRREMSEPVTQFLHAPLGAGQWCWEGSPVILKPGRSEDMQGRGVTAEPLVVSIFRYKLSRYCLVPA